jgi:hypothetical protein
MLALIAETGFEDKSTKMAENLKKLERVIIYV